MIFFKYHFNECYWENFWLPIKQPVIFSYGAEQVHQ